MAETVDGSHEVNPYLVVAEKLTKRFGKLTAVDSISLKVQAGEFFGFLGPNGAGKSTTIKLMCGLLRPDSGEVRIAGYDLSTEPLRVKANIGTLLEDPPLYERLTAEEYLVFAGKMYGLSTEEALSRTEELLELMDLNDARRKMIADYSMGMKKKTAFASALIHSPKVLFLDEPFNGIDPISVRAIRNVLQRIRDKGTTIFFCTHVMEVAERLCTRVAIINRGRIVGEGTLPELRARAEADLDSTLEDIFVKLVEAPGEGETLSWI